MKRRLLQIARRIRHTPTLEKQDWLWNRVRAPYHAMLRRGGTGVALTLNNQVAVTIPPDATGWASWDTYEPEGIEALVDWLRANPTGTLVDVGCSVGVYALVALFTAPSARVIALDADIPSLAKAQWLTQHAPNQRLELIHCFAGSQSASTESVSHAAQRTQALLNETTAKVPTRYRTLPANEESSIPVLALDDLLDELPRDAPLFIKIDVEGAESLVLEGCRETLLARRPALLLSVHPPMLPLYSSSIEALSAFLDAHGYRHRLLAEDHEQHWWCVPAEMPSPARDE